MLSNPTRSAESGIMLVPMQSFGNNPGMKQAIGATELDDGTTVAYAVSGNGPPLIVIPAWVSHVELGWAVAAEKEYFEALSEGRTVIRYDRPGSGLSGPSNGRDLVALEDDVIEAIRGALSLDRFDLLGSSIGSGLAINWAARHPGTVDHLVVYGGWPDGSALTSPAIQQQLVTMIREHWGLGSEIITGIFAPDGDAPFRRGFAEHQRVSATADEAARALAACYAINVTDDLHRVRARTTVIHRERDRAAPLSGAQALASGIEGATLVVLHGRDHIPYASDRETLVDVIRTALELPRRRRTTSTPLTRRQLEVAALIAIGLTNREIAEKLVVTERTAESHVEAIRDRLGLHSRTQVAAWYLTTYAKDR